MDDDTSTFESTMGLKDSLALADEALERYEENDHGGFFETARKIPLPPQLAIDIALSPFLGGVFLAERFGEQLSDMEKYDAQDGT